MNSKVAIIGLGAMGAALARAQLAAGFPTTVWNRTKIRAEALAAEGAMIADTAAEAARAADVTLICVDTNSSAEAALQDIWDKGDLNGRTLVQLGTTTPAEARSIAAKITTAGGKALTGAIMCYPDSVGPENTATLMVGGDREGFDAAEPHLRQISGNLIDLGDNVAAAAALSLGLLTTSMALYAGVAHAAHLCEAEGASLDLLARLCLHGPVAPKRFEIIEKGAFALNSLHDGGSLEVWADVADNIRDQAHAAGINSELPDFFSGLYRRGVEAGHGAEDVAALVKLLRGSPS